MAKSTAKKTTARKSTAAKDTRDRAEKVIDAEQDQGFFGNKVDPTPNEAYTVSGVVAGMETPETDSALAAEAKEAADRAGIRDPEE